jgi:hypothetical protein
MMWTFTPAGSLTVGTNTENGNVALSESGQKPVSSTVCIKADERPAVALAVLGGITDELLERVAVWGDLNALPPKEIARSILEETFYTPSKEG